MVVDKGGGISSAFPGTTQYLSVETIGMRFYWLVDPDNIMGEIK